MKHSTPIAYLICGFIGAGKTTFARKLESETGAVRITKDEWLVRIFGSSIARDTRFSEYDKSVTELATDLAFKILKSGADVIIDEGFWPRSQRDQMKERIIGLGARPVLYFVDCSVEEMRNRTIDRSKSPPVDSFEIDEEMFDDYLKYWEPPAREEDYLLAE